MSKDIFGATEIGLNKRLKLEKKQVDNIARVFNKIIGQIENTAEKDGWQSLVIFSDKNILFGDLLYSEKCMLLYFLRRHPNIITKLSDKEKKNLAKIKKPYAFKWVKSNEKSDLGINANVYRNLSGVLNEIINLKMLNYPVESSVDILSVLELLYGRKDRWIELTVYNISMFSGVPIENTEFALNELLKLKLIVIAYVRCKQMKNRFKFFIKVTITESEYNEAIEGQGIDAAKILTKKNAIESKSNFATIEYFSNAIKIAAVEGNEFSEEHIETTYFTENNSANENNLSKTLEVITTEENKSAKLQQPINITVPEIKGLGQILIDMKNCMMSFTEIAQLMQKNELEKNETISSIIQEFSKQRIENENLINQMNIMKRLLNKQEKDKAQFIKSIQDALNMMMGQIITATDKFTEIPRHQMDEYKIQKHKVDVIKIAVQTAEEISKLIKSNPN